jgi:Putative peptidoglycan binding domain
MTDHILVTARTAGFRTIKTVFDAPENAELKRLRVNPNTLADDDVVSVPVLAAKVATGSTNQTLLFTLNADELLLNIRLQDATRKPLVGRAVHLVLGARSITNPTPDLFRPIDRVTDANGEISVEMNINVSEGELSLHETAELTSPVVAVMRLLVGTLQPANTSAGQRARLNNMGYFAGFSDGDTQQIKWAIEEFQHDHGLKPTGRTDDPVTFNTIARVHGDLLKSETVPIA